MRYYHMTFMVLTQWRTSYANISATMTLLFHLIKAVLNSSFVVSFWLPLLTLLHSASVQLAAWPTTIRWYVWFINKIHLKHPLRQGPLFNFAFPLRVWRRAEHYFKNGLSRQGSVVTVVVSGSAHWKCFLFLFLEGTAGYRTYRTVSRANCM